MGLSVRSALFEWNAWGLWRSDVQDKQMDTFLTQEWEYAPKFIYKHIS